MLKVNQNYLKLQGSYLFSNIAQKVKSYKEEHKTEFAENFEDVFVDLQREFAKTSEVSEDKAHNKYAARRS